MSTMSSTITTNIAASPPGSRRTLRIGFHVRAGYAGAGFLSLFRRFLCAVDCFFLLVSEVRFPFSCRFSGLSVSRSVYACFRTEAGNLPRAGDSGGSLRGMPGAGRGVAGLRQGSCGPRSCESPQKRQGRGNYTLAGVVCGMGGSGSCRKVCLLNFFVARLGPVARSASRATDNWLVVLWKMAAAVGKARTGDPDPRSGVVRPGVGIRR